MTWNEWKTAGNAALRSRFYLYLVGNLRADLGARPFIRAIHDPFATLNATEQSGNLVKRTVKLEIHAFPQAEFQELTVREDSTQDQVLGSSRHLV